MIRLTINGKEREIDGETDLASFLRSHGRNPRLVVVELNGEIIRMNDYEATRLHDGDVLELAHMVAGGSDARGRRNLLETGIGA